VLVVEDDLDSAQYYSDVLSSVGLIPTLAHTVADALEASHTRSFALALIDIRLPDGNGYELCRSILADTDRHSFSALLMSGDPGLRDVANIARVGAKGFIINPVEPAVLAQQVLAAVDHHDSPPVQIQVGADLANQAVKMCFFGRGRVETNGVSVQIPSGRSLEIIGSLAAACPSAMSSERLARFAWHERPTVSTNAVYTAVSRLRQYLNDHRVGGFLDNDGDGYFLRIDPANIDLVEFASRGAEVLRGGPRSSGQFEEVLSMWQPISLDNSANPLITHWMQRLHEMWAQLSEALAGAHINEQQYDTAAMVCRDLLDSDPWRESVWATLMVALYRAGRPNDALSAFADARRRLRNELGLDPGPSLRSLEMMVLTHDQALTAAAPPGVAASIGAVRNAGGLGR
jgi:DNA-binding response OmpR family regulator